MRIEKGLKKVAGVEDAAVNLATERATVTLDPTIATTDDLIAQGARDRLRCRAVRRARRGRARTGAQDDAATENEPQGEIAGRGRPTRARPAQRRKP